MAKTAKPRGSGKSATRTTRAKVARVFEPILNGARWTWALVGTIASATKSKRASTAQPETPKLPDGVCGARDPEKWRKAFRAARRVKNRAKWRACPLFIDRPTVARVETIEERKQAARAMLVPIGPKRAPDFEERKQAARELRAELAKRREQNAHIPTACAWVETLRARCRACAFRLIDRVSGKGKAYALPTDEVKRARSIALGRHRVATARKAWDYLGRELAEELFSAVLAHAAPRIVRSGELLDDGARANWHDETWSIFGAINSPDVWRDAYRDAQGLFHKMADIDRDEVSETTAQPEREETTERARDLEQVTECLAAYYSARAPRNAETLLRADREAIRALQRGEIRFDAKGNAFAKFLRIAKRANDGAALLGRDRAPLDVVSVRRSAGRPSTMTV